MDLFASPQIKTKLPVNGKCKPVVATFEFNPEIGFMRILYECRLQHPSDNGNAVAPKAPPTMNHTNFSTNTLAQKYLMSEG